MEYTLAPSLQWRVLCYLDLETRRPDGDALLPTVVDYKVKTTPVTRLRRRRARLARMDRPARQKRDAVTFRARQVLFEGGRPTSASTADHASEQNGANSDVATIGDGELAAVSAPSGEGSASADDLPF